MSKPAESWEICDLKDMLRGMRGMFEIDRKHFELLNRWLEIEENNCDFNALLPLVQIANPVQCSQFLHKWLQKGQNNLTTADFHTLTMRAKQPPSRELPDFLSFLAMAWIERNNGDFTIFTQALDQISDAPAQEIERHRSAFTLSSRYIEQNRQKLSVANFITILGRNHTSTHGELLKTWFKNTEPQNLLPEITAIFQTARGLNNTHALEPFLNLLKELHRERKLSSRQITDLYIQYCIPTGTGDVIFSTRHANRESYALVVPSMILQRIITIETESDLQKIARKLSVLDYKLFINELNDLPRELLAKALNIKFCCDHKKDGEILQNLFPSLQQAFKPEALEKFGGGSFADIYAIYYYRQGAGPNRNALEDLFALMLPEAVAVVKRKLFNLPSHKPYLQPRELVQLRKMNQTVPDADSLPSMRSLCDYLRDKVYGKLRKIDERRDVFAINFNNTKFSGEDLSAEVQAQKEELSEILLFALENRNAEDPPFDVQKLYNLISDTQPDENHPPLNEGQKRQFAYFFLRSNYEIRHLLQKEDGLVKFSGTLSAILDGCHANMGNQASIALAMSMFDDKRDQVLCSYYFDEILNPIINSGRGDLIMLQTDAFSHEAVHHAIISPTGFVNELVKYFHNPLFEEGRGRFDTLSFLRDDSVLGATAVDVIMARLKILEQKPPQEQVQLREYLAQIAAYLIVEKFMPALLEQNEELQEFAESCQDNISLIKRWEVAESRAQQAVNRISESSAPAHAPRQSSATVIAANQPTTCNFL